MGSAQQGGIMGMLLPLALFVVIFYFLIVRPQKKKQKTHDQMLAAIGRGDRVVTAGGFFGVVREVMEDSFILEVAEGVKVRIQKSSISHKRNPEDEKPKGTPKKGKEAEVAPEETPAVEAGSSKDA